MASSKKSMMVVSPDRSELMEISSLEQKDGNLIIKGKIMGAMPMTAVIRPDEARKGLSLINMRMAWFLLTFLFRKAQVPTRKKM